MGGGLLDWAVQLAIAEENARLISKQLELLRQTAGLTYIRTNRSIHLSIDLSKRHEDEPLGLRHYGAVFLWLTVEKADSPFTFKLLERGIVSQPFLGVQGVSITEHEFTEIYITNEPGKGEAVIVAGWRE